MSSAQQVTPGETDRGPTQTVENETNLLTVKVEGKEEEKEGNPVSKNSNWIDVGAFHDFLYSFKTSRSISLITSVGGQTL